MAIQLLEKMIEAVSPQWAARREAYRNAIRYYQAGEVNRFNSKWIPVNETDQENIERGERDLIRARCRWLERNSDIAQSAVAGVVRNVVSTGIRMQARTENEELNQRIEEAFSSWAKATNCDITKQQNFYELQRMVLERKFVDGEVLVKKITVSGRKIPFALQVLRCDLLDSSLVYAPNSGNVVRAGIELTDYLEPVAYWVNPKTPNGYEKLSPDRIPAEDIIHLWSKRYPDQIRGISDLAVSTKRIKDLDEYLDAETVAAKLAACFSIFITKQNFGVGMANMAKQQGLVDAEGKPLTRIRPGMIVQLAAGDDVKAANPGRSATTAGEYANLHQRLIGAGQGLSYEMISRDFKQASYSAARQGNLEDRRTFMPIQDWLIEHFCQPVYETWLDRAVLAGELYIPDYFSDPDKYRNAIEWIKPGWQSIDPEKEALADVIEMKNGCKTMAQRCAEHGLDWRDQLAQMAKEKELAEELGLVLPIHTPESVQAAESNHNTEVNEDG